MFIFIASFFFLSLFFVNVLVYVVGNERVFGYKKKKLHASHLLYICIILSCIEVNNFVMIVNVLNFICFALSRFIKLNYYNINPFVKHI